MQAAAEVILPIKEIPFNEVLQAQCIEFWGISLVWNGRSNKRVSVGEAFDKLNKILAECNPSRPLAHRINILKYDMVEHGTKPKRVEADNVNQRPKITVL